MGRRKVTLTDAELLERFGNDCIRFSDIAAECGVSRERIRQIYNARFKRLCPGRKSGHQRVKVCTRKRAAMMDPLNATALEAVTRATVAGLEAKGDARVVLVRDGQRTHQQRRVRAFSIRVNGIRCHVRPGYRMAQQRHNEYWRIRARSRSGALAALYTLILCGDDTYILPQAALKQAMRGSSMCIPIVRLRHGPGSGHPGHPPRFDFEPYRNAWELLR